jgi:hypothetical protein
VDIVYVYLVGVTIRVPVCLSPHILLSSSP